MSLLQDRIPSIGLHLLYEPEKSNNTLIDVVLVHGLGGHPMKSWQYDERQASTRTKTDPHTPDRSLKYLLKRTKSSDNTHQSNIGSAVLARNKTWHPESKAPPSLFWPRDLLPIACPEARIITWGYYTLRNGNTLVPTQPDIFAHANELFRELRDFRSSSNAQQRPLIFIAHSIGGIIVKEVLRQAEFSNMKSEQDILSSTAATIFFGCPHRAVEQVPLVDVVSSMAEASSGITTESSVASALYGVHNVRWSEAQESFVRLWHHFNFVVKTYQERRSDTNNLINCRAESSKIGNAREDAESLPADHRTMCQFTSVSDAGFRSLSKVLQDIMKDEKIKRQGLTPGERHCLQKLVSPPIPGSQMPAAGRSLGTCRRISNTREFCDWYRRHGGSNERVLWLTGAAGSGKSTQLRHLRCRMEKQWMSATTSIIYCSAEGQSLDRIFVSGSKLGNKRSVMTIRSLLSQLFAEDLDLRQRLSDLFDDRASDADLTRFFLDSYITSKLRTLARRSFILVDAEDSCDSVYILELLNCLCQMAQNSSFSVCLASQPTSGDIPANVTHLELKNNNFEEIEYLVKSRLRATWEERSVLVKNITEKAQGSLLWARLATNLLNETIDGGGAQDLVDQILGEFPADIYGLYEWILGTLSSKEKVDATTIMRWAMLSPEPMVLNDLRMAVCLARTSFLDCCDPYTALDVGLPWSMQELQKTGKHFDTPSQFYHWLRTRTCGLLETRPAAKEGKGQQSLGLQHVYPIHESVRSFFLSGRGFAALSSGRATTISSNREAVDLCHYSLVRTILIYLNTSDLSPLVSGQRLPKAESSALSPEKSPTWRKNVDDQRNLIMSSYPFLRYAVDNLLYHLLSPRPLRYFLPQQALFNTYSSNDCRIWRRWTALLGETDASAILAGCKSAEELLQPEFGASFRLERVFRAVNKMATGDSWFSPHRNLRLPVEARKAKGDEVAHQKLDAPRPLSLPLSRTTRRGPRSRGTVITTRRR